MTRMLPPTIHSTTQSTAERRLFETIRDAPNTATWLCLHSLSLAHHDTKRRAEIDFVLLTHHGIFILEAKAGRLKRRKGIWYSVDKQDAPHQLPESPFDQAASAMFALQKRLRTHFNGQPHADPLFGYGVLTPDIVFDLDSPESDRRLVYDSRDTAHPFTRYINRLAEHSRAAEARDKRPALKPEAIDAIAHYLRGDFDFIPTADALLDDVRKQLDQLTQEQRMGLRRLSEDDVPHLGSASLDDVTWSIVSGFKGLENYVVVLAALTDIETDWHRGVAYVGMSRARAHAGARRHSRGLRQEATGEYSIRRHPDAAGQKTRTAVSAPAHQARIRRYRPGKRAASAQ